MKLFCFRFQLNAVYLGTLFIFILSFSNSQAAYRVLGINSAGNLFSKDGIINTDPMGPVGKWTQVTTSDEVGKSTAKYVTIGANGLIWLLTKYNKLFQTRNLSSWIRIDLPPGGISQMSAGNDTLVALTPEGKAFYLKDISKDNPTGSSWEQLSGTETFTNISISLSGKLWAIGTDKSINTRDGIDSKYKWNKADNKTGLTQISVGEDNVPWGVNKDTMRFYDLRGGNWHDLSAQTYNGINLFGTYIAMQSKDQIWALHNEPSASGDYRVFYFKQNVGWIEAGGGLVQIAVGPLSSPLIRQLTIRNLQVKTEIAVQVIDKSNNQKIQEMRIIGKDTPAYLHFVCKAWDSWNGDGSCYGGYSSSRVNSSGTATTQLKYNCPYTLNIAKRQITGITEPTANNVNTSDDEKDINCSYQFDSAIKNSSYEIPANNLAQTIDIP